MKNVIPSRRNAFTFYTTIVNSLRSEPQKVKVFHDLDAEVKRLFCDYDQAFLSNKLLDLEPSKQCQKQKQSLISLYRRDRKALRSLFLELTTGKGNIYIAFCPYCSASVAESLDHFLPKSKFPEYSVHPRNLVPSCLTCNTYKQNTYQELLNLYTDVIPRDKQYLFVQLRLNRGLLEVDFYLKNEEGIDAELFSKLEASYKVLKLCERYKTASKEPLEDLIKDINLCMSDNVTIESAKIKLLKCYELFYQEKGKNYWIYVFKKACIQNDHIFTYLLNRMRKLF